MKMRNLSLALLLTVSWSACKRQKLEVDPTLSQSKPLVGVDNIGKLNRSGIIVEKEDNDKRLADLDAKIANLKARLAGNPSASEKTQLENDLKTAENDRLVVQQKQDELAKKLDETQKALEEAKNRNEELKKELEQKKKEEGPGGQENPNVVTPGNNTNPMTPGTEMKPEQPKSYPQIGPYAITKTEKCLSVAQKSTSDKAPVESANCAFEDNQLFMLEEATEDNAFRIIAVHSQKCLTLSGTGIKVGDKLQQTPCERTLGALGERFFLLGVNDYDVVLQSALTGFCVVIKDDGSLIQDQCSDTTTYYRLRKKPVK